MATIVTRSGKGTPLTNTEMDANFTNLNNELVALSAASALGAGSAINLANHSLFSKTITGATTFTLSNIPASGIIKAFVLDLTNGGSATITWWANLKWASGPSAPSLTAAGRDVLGFITYDAGATWTGVLIAKDAK